MSTPSGPLCRSDPPQEGVCTAQEVQAHYRESLLHPGREGFFKDCPIGVSWTLTVEVLLQEMIASDLSPQQKLLELQNTFLYAVDTSDPKIQDLSRREWERHFARKGTPLKDLPPEVEESPYYCTEKTFLSESRRCSLDFLSKLNLAMDIRSTLGASFDAGATVLEIGAGFGQLARVVKRMSPGTKYVILDLPESLYFSCLYLGMNFPESVRCWANDASSLAAAISRGTYDFLFVPCHLAPDLGALGCAFDAAINKSSFGEMHNKTSAYYVNLLQQQLQVTHVFLLNRFLNTVDPWVQTYRIRENQWFDNLDGRWEILHWEVDPEFTRFPYNEILQHRELYFIGRRAAEAAPSEPVSDILLQKWNTNFTTIPFARHSKTLAVELGRGGTLEKLVNRVRLVRDAEAVDALIKYIYLLEGKFPFEERFYYAGLYRTLTGKRHRLATPSPQRSSFWGRLLLTVTGVGFALRSPAIPRLIVRTLRKMGINVGWTYRMLKRLLFRER